MRLSIDEIKSSRSFITQILKGASFLSVGVGVYSLCNFLFRYILIHTWTPSDYGIFTLLFTIVGLLGIFTEFDLNATTTIFLAKDIKNPANKRTLVEILCTFVLLISLFLIITFIVTHISSFDFPLIDVLRQYFAPIWILVIATGLTAISWGLLRAYKKMNYEASSNIVRGLSLLGLILAAIYVFPQSSIKLSVDILIISQFVAFLVAIGFVFKKSLLGMSFRNLPLKRLISVFKSVSFSNIRFILIFSFFMSGLSMCTTLLLSIDRIMIPWFLSTAMLGFYGGASLIAGIPRLITATVATSLAPFVSERSEDVAEAKRQYFNLLMLFIFLALIGYGLFIYFSQYLVPILLTEEYNWVTPTLRILLAGMFFADIFSLNATFVASIRRTKILRQMMGVLAGVVVVNLALNWVFIPKLGIEGAAIASVISFAIAGFISTGQLKKIK